MNESHQNAAADDIPAEEAAEDVSNSVEPEEESQVSQRTVFQPSPDRSHDEWGDRQDYRGISIWSIVALVLAALSSLAVVTPIFLGVVPLAILASLVALARIRQEPHHFMGRSIAILSLVAAVILGSWSYGRSVFFQGRMYAAAEENVLDWFQLLREGKRKEAHQLSLLPGMRVSGKTTLTEYYLNEKKAREEMQSFFSEPAMSIIIELGEESSLQLMENWRLEITDDVRLLAFQRFLIEYDDDGSPTTLAVEIKSSRMFDKYTRTSHWTVLTVQALQ
jgi:hypothetical protein